MTETNQGTPIGENRLLAMLPADQRDRLLRAGEEVKMEVRDVLYEPNEPIAFVHFPIDGVASLLTVMDDGGIVEVATVGNEGMVGLPVFLGAGSIPGRAVAQVPGAAIRIPSTAFQEELGRNGTLRDSLQRYTQALFTLISQSAACNRLHPIDERCARWLLMTHDRVGGDQFQLTQEFLSQMVGVRRASVTVAAGALQKAGLIEYRRGIIRVEDRKGLEAASCECYGVIKREFDRLLG